MRYSKAVQNLQDVYGKPWTKSGWVWLGVLIGCLTLPVHMAADESLVSQEATTLDWQPLFNGVDLSGWVPVNVHPTTFTVRDGMIISTGKPTGIMRTERPYENFVLELEYKHVYPKGNAGLFIWSDPLPAVGVPFSRSIEVQVMDGIETENYTSHGDLFSIHGATMIPDRPHPNGWQRCLPSERRTKPAGEWNHYRVECRDGVLKLAVNGKVVSGASGCQPRKGYICLEAEGSEAHFRNLKIAELLTTKPSATETAEMDQGFQPLFVGIDFAQWNYLPGHQNHWRSQDWKIVYDGNAEGEVKDLWTKKSYKNFQLICDWRFPSKPTTKERPVILANGEYDMNADGQPKQIAVLDAGDSGIYLRGNIKSQVNLWCWPIGSGEVYGYRTDTNQPAAVRAGVTPRLKADRSLGQWNRMIINMVGDQLSVTLNGQKILENAQLPGVPESGPIGLQHHGDPIEFANLFIKELPDSSTNE